jgi:dihydrodipicolinate synthase/N-acetylneuraminate lyase
MMSASLSPENRARLLRGMVIPAHPLALTAARRLDERRQRALTRYYSEAGSGGLAVGVHTTQFEIHDPAVGLYRPVLELAAETMDACDEQRAEPLFRIAGIVGRTAAAVAEAELAVGLGYHAGLVSLSAFKEAGDADMVDHLRAVSAVIPVVGFYLQPAVGGRRLGVDFWREVAALPGLVAIKVAPFNRYDSIDVARAVAESGRAEYLALYTGNDENIYLDLLTRYRFGGEGQPEVAFRGGLLGQWAVWTRRAVEHFEELRALRESGAAIPADWLTVAQQLTDANAVVFDAANQFAGCITGIHEVLRRQGLLEGIWTLNPAEGLSPGQAEALDRIEAAYPHLHDNAFVEERLDGWLRD